MSFTHYKSFNNCYLVQLRKVNFLFNAKYAVDFLLNYNTLSKSIPVPFTKLQSLVAVAGTYSMEVMKSTVICVLYPIYRRSWARGQSWMQCHEPLNNASESAGSFLSFISIGHLHVKGQEQMPVRNETLPIGYCTVSLQLANCLLTTRPYLSRLVNIQRA